LLELILDRCHTCSSMQHPQRAYIMLDLKYLIAAEAEVHASAGDA
jgi:hypothetical protein